MLFVEPIDSNYVGYIQKDHNLLLNINCCLFYWIWI